MQNNTIKKMFSDMGYDFNTMPINEPIEIKGNWEIQTISKKTGDVIWAKINKIVRKESTVHMVVETAYHKLSCSPNHKIYVKTNKKSPRYKEVGDLFKTKAKSNYEIKTLSGWEKFTITKEEGLLEIADVEVEEEHSYVSDGILSHNTMYGDPTTTPGGMAIPYAASTRLRLSTGSPIKVGKDNQVIGIEVDVKTIKNKVSKPFRSCSFEIHFGRGIFEHGQIFDVLRQYCESIGGFVKYNDKRISVEGTGAWKTFTVFDEKTQTTTHEIKFNRSEFDKKVLNVPELQEYVNALMEAAYIMSSDADDHITYKGAEASL